MKPPFPAIEGLYASPTVVNNVETLTAVPQIIEMGGENWRNLGTEKSGGTKLWSVSGHVKKPGVYELPMGYADMERFIMEDCGGIRNDKKLKAVIPGGSSVYIMNAEQIIGKKLNELHGLDENVLQNAIEGKLGLFEDHRRHCFDLCFETLQDAFADFRAFQIEEFSGEKALICTCFGVSEETIEKVIMKNSLATIEEVTDFCNAGGGCGSCQPLIQEIIDTIVSEDF
jgi:bacterioferritin-associated ferredoxin